MRTGIVAFILGNISFLYYLPFEWSQQSRIEPHGYYLLLLIIVVISLSLLSVLYKARTIIVSSQAIIYKNFYTRLIRLIVMFLCGYIFTAIYINQFYPALDLENMEGKNIIVKGYVESIPHITKKKLSFQFVITAIKKPHQAGEKIWDDSFNGKVRLSWYKTKTILRNHQQWQLTIRLKKPNGLLNGGFDYEKWLYQNRILATGYVREGYQLDFSTPSLFRNSLSGLRQKVADKLDKSLSDYAYKGLIKALTIGIRHDIEPQQWQQFLRTGTNHLIAISGLHISLMSSLAWLLVNTLWRTNSHLNMRYPATHAASIGALFIAILYASLAGFAIPTQRALIMLSVVFLAIMFRREFLSSYILLLALLAVVVFDPLSPLSPGFWLSFGAVAVIFFTISSRLSHKTDNKKKKVFKLAWLQIAIFIGLLPPLMILFHQFSLISPLANFVVVPLMSFIIVPVTFLATGLLFVYEPLGQMVFNLLIWPIDGLFGILDNLSQWSLSLIYMPEPTWIIVLLVIIGSFWLLMPKGWPGRSLGLLLFLPAFLLETEKLPQGQIKMTVLDVGQGLAMIIRTQNHTLVYDTGDKFSDSFNMADMVILPYMRSHGIKIIDKLIISHSDRDHAGSYKELVEQVKIKQVLAGEPEQINVNLSSNLDKTVINKKLLIVQCQQSQQWQWDGVTFEVLSPTDLMTDSKNNNRSCVIHITSAAGQTILLTGDIEKMIEKQLVKDYPQLKADVLQVPHHGSRTSSSAVFLEHIQPEIALFSFGYKNRFHHPAQKVLQTYKKKQVNLYNTNNGAIEINSNITNNSFSVIEYRVDKKMFWHREVNQL